MSQTASPKNNGGFTLVELLIAVLISIVGMFGVLETINVTLQHNLKNELRNEAVRVGERYMTELRGGDFDAIVASYPFANVTSSVRGVKKTFVVERSSVNLGFDSLGSPTTKQVNVVVKWAFRNVTSQNRVMSVVAKP